MIGYCKECCLLLHRTSPCCGFRKNVLSNSPLGEVVLLLSSCRGAEHILEIWHYASFSFGHQTTPRPLAIYTSIPGVPGVHFGIPISSILIYFTLNFPLPFGIFFYDTMCIFRGLCLFGRSIQIRGERVKELKDPQKG